jgi:hypothetical protein
MSVIFRLESPYRGEYQLHRLTFGSGDPVVSLVAGVHGNEVNGNYALNLLAGMFRLQPPRGTVHLLPCVNTFGAEGAQKRWPFDDRDLNEAFPGRPDGSPVERVAHAVVEATAGTVGIDVQTGSAFVHEAPHARVPFSGHALQLGRAAGLPITWRRSPERLDEGLVGAWRRAGQTALVLRGGRGGALDLEDARTLARALVRVLGDLGVVNHAEPAADSVVTSEVHDHRTVAGGFVVPEVRPGDRVHPGQLLGVVRAPLGGAVVEEIACGGPGTVLAVRVYPVVHARELVVRIAGPS